MTDEKNFGTVVGSWQGVVSVLSVQGRFLRWRGSQSLRCRSSTLLNARKAGWIRLPLSQRTATRVGFIWREHFPELVAAVRGQRWSPVTKVPRDSHPSLAVMQALLHVRSARPGNYALASGICCAHEGGRARWAYVRRSVLTHLIFWPGKTVIAYCNGRHHCAPPCPRTVQSSSLVARQATLCPERALDVRVVRCSSFEP